MSEKNDLEILDFEDKKTNDGKRYTRFKTSKGWMSCFDKIAIDKLKENEGKRVTVETSQKGDFFNIRKFVGIAKSPQNEAQDHHEPQKGRDMTSMYVSYAKDLFLGFLEKYKDIPTFKESIAMMQNCTKLVKVSKDTMAEEETENQTEEPTEDVDEEEAQLE